MWYQQNRIPWQAKRVLYIDLENIVKNTTIKWRIRTEGQTYRAGIKSIWMSCVWIELRYTCCCTRTGCEGERRVRVRRGVSMGLVGFPGSLSLVKACCLLGLLSLSLKSIKLKAIKNKSQAQCANELDSSSSRSRSRISAACLTPFCGHFAILAI